MLFSFPKNLYTSLLREWLNMDFNELNAKLNAWLNETLDKLMALPTDEKYAYSSITFGVLLLFVAVIVW